MALKLFNDVTQRTPATDSKGEFNTRRIVRAIMLAVPIFVAPVLAHQRLSAKAELRRLRATGTAAPASDLVGGNDLRHVSRGADADARSAGRDASGRHAADRHASPRDDTADPPPLR